MSWTATGTAAHQQAYITRHLGEWNIVKDDTLQLRFAPSVLICTTEGESLGAEHDDAPLKRRA